MIEERHEDGKGNVVIRKDGQWAISKDNGKTFQCAISDDDGIYFNTSLRRQKDRLAEFLMKEYPDEVGKDESSIELAIRLLKR